jgi:hypothetical protein
VLEGLSLHRDQVGKVEHLREPGERQTFAGRETRQSNSSGAMTRADQGLQDEQ